MDRMRADGMRRSRPTPPGLVLAALLLMSSIFALAAVGPVHAAHEECRVTDEPGDDQLASIAKRVPAFAGFYVDGSSLSVWLTDDGESLEAAVQEILSLYSDVPEGSDLADLTPVALPARYSFMQLFCWYNAEMLEIEGNLDYIYTDIDEATNRLTVAVEDLAAEGPAWRAMLVEAGIPLDAVDIIEEEPFMFLPGPGDTNPLLSPQRSAPLSSPQRSGSLVGIGLVFVGIASVAFVAWREKRRSLEERGTLSPQGN